MNPKRRPSAFTLVEMLVAMAVTLILVLSIAQVFAMIGEATRTSRSVMELSGQMRDARNRLQEDLANLTVGVKPWPAPGAGLGYFEYYEGPITDQDTVTPQPTNLPPTLLGDYDDVLMFTVRNDHRPFVGEIAGELVENDVSIGGYRVVYDPANPSLRTPIESTVAEVVWFISFETEPWTLHRRVLLVRPDIDLSESPAIGALNRHWFFNLFDLSARPDPGGGWRTNSLADLTQRENRFAHVPTAFPFPFDPTLLVKKDTLFDSSGDVVYDGQGSDVVLTNVLGFDVRVYDPRAPIQQIGTDLWVVPGDPGFDPTDGTVVAQGAYVDLGYAVNYNSPSFELRWDVSDFSNLPNPKSQLRDGFEGRTYDTWSLHYEMDGRDHDGTGGPDQGRNGLDSSGYRIDVDPGTGWKSLQLIGPNGVVDDVHEMETAPPYRQPIRGLEVRLRSWEPDTRQVRQSSVIADFVP